MSLANINQKGVSVVICCFNSRHRIVPTLEHLALQKGIEFPWEVILVDNNSTDGTSEIAIETWNKNNSPCPFRVIKELRPGTMHARKKGIEVSNYRYLLYCDDDNWLNENYIKTAFSTIGMDERISAVGGIGFLEFEKAPPDWIAKFVKKFGGGPQGKRDGDITFDKGFLYTAGAVLDRIWLDRLYSSGFESSLKGRDGKSLVAGEDTELTFALKLIGGKLHYSSQMHFKHFMPNGRMTWKYLKKLEKSNGYAEFLISPYKNYFRKDKHKPVILITIQQLFTLLKFFLLSTRFLFAEGNRNVIKFHRSLGNLNACIFNYQTFHRNRMMVEKLSLKIKNWES
jgi:glycosyltransferase involved in cell wall biosynthesis